MPAMQCDGGRPAGERAGCWIDALVWAQATLIDGVGLGARSQPLPPHRKRLSRKERAAEQADRDRRRARAVDQVCAAVTSSTAIDGLLSGWLLTAGPGHWPVYQGLLQGLVRYRQLASAPIATLPQDLPIAAKKAHRRRKQRRQWLRKMLPRHRESVRVRLCAEGYCAPPATAPIAEPVVAVAKRKRRRRAKAPAIPLDEALTRRLRAWQEHRGLRPSGLVDKPTRQQFDVPMASRVQQIELAMQRIRDTEVGASSDFLIANIPAFRLDVWRGHKLQASHLTQVGKGIKRVRRRVNGRRRWLWVPGMRTPSISSKLKYLVVNPEWVVPSSIRREYRWKIRGDDNWLADNGFVIRPASNGGNYMVMKAGEGNLLGRVKFLFRNTHLVYLHDTPKQRGFKYPVRLRSHGCVRVERAFELARGLLAHDQGKPWSEKRWYRYLDKYTDKWIRLKTPIDLHIVYWTADVSRDGQVRFYRDFYNHDQHDLQRIVAVADARLPRSVQKAGKQLPAGPATAQPPVN